MKIFVAGATGALDSPLVVIWYDFVHGNNDDLAADEPITARFDRGQYEAALRSAVAT